MYFTFKVGRDVPSTSDKRRWFIEHLRHHYGTKQIEKASKDLWHHLRKLILTNRSKPTRYTRLTTADGSVTRHVTITLRDHALDVINDMTNGVKIKLTPENIKCILQTLHFLCQGHDLPTVEVSSADHTADDDHVEPDEDRVGMLVVTRCGCLFLQSAVDL